MNQQMAATQRLQESDLLHMTAIIRVESEKQGIKYTNRNQFDVFVLNEIVKIYMYIMKYINCVYLKQKVHLNCKGDFLQLETELLCIIWMLRDKNVFENKLKLICCIKIFI